MKIPVYFLPLRGIESKKELVSKLLSIFADASQVSSMSSSHWLIQCLQQMQNPFVLILDNADDLLESGDAKRKQQVFRLIDEILAQCKNIKLLLTTRESLDFFGHTIPVHLEKINVLDEVSAASLVKLLLPDVSENDRSCVVKECGQVPLAIRLMCCIMREENVSLNDVLEERKGLPLIEVLDSESFRHNVRLKSLINTAFQRLSFREKNALVSLAVFPGWFRIGEATAILDVKTELTSEKIIRSLERKALIDCVDNFTHFTIHSLLRSFIDEKRSNDKSLEAVFLSAQLQFYDYYISSFRTANEKFLMGCSNEASAIFIDRRECILSALANGIKDDKLYPKVVEVLSKAERFLFVVLLDEKLLFEHLYDIAVQEAEKRQIVEDQRQLLVAKSFRHWGWCSMQDQHWDHSLYAGCNSAKLQHYHTIHQLLASSHLKSVDQFNSRRYEDFIKKLVYPLPKKLDLKTKVDEVGSDMKTAAAEMMTKVDEIGSDMKTAAEEVKTKVDEVGSDVKTAVAEVKTKVDEVGSDMKTAAEEVKTKVDEVGSDVKTAVEEVRTKVDEVGSDVKTAVAEVKTKVDEVGSDMKTAAEEVKTKVDEVGSDVKTAVAEVKTKVDEVGSDVKTKVHEVGSDVKEVKSKVDYIKQAMLAGTSKGEPTGFCF